MEHQSLVVTQGMEAASYLVAQKDEIAPDTWQIAVATGLVRANRLRARINGNLQPPTYETSFVVQSASEGLPQIDVSQAALAVEVQYPDSVVLHWLSTLGATEYIIEKNGTAVDTVPAELIQYHQWSSGPISDGSVDEWAIRPFDPETAYEGEPVTQTVEVVTLPSETSATWQYNGDLTVTLT